MNLCFVQAKARSQKFRDLCIQCLRKRPIQAGDIHIWDRESSTLLHHFYARDLDGGDITCIAWNPAADPYMFATGRHDGTVRVWTTPGHAATLGPTRQARGNTSQLADLSDQEHTSHPTLHVSTSVSLDREAFESAPAETAQILAPSNNDG